MKPSSHVFGKHEVILAAAYLREHSSQDGVATLDQSVGKFRPVVENHSTAHVNSIFKSYYWQSNLFANRIYDLSFFCFSRFSLLFLALSS